MDTPRPVILAVDEHPDVLRALERELRRYRTDYGVRVLSGGPDAMMELTRLARSRPGGGTRAVGRLRLRHRDHRRARARPPAPPDGQARPARSVGRLGGPFAQRSDSPLDGARPHRLLRPEAGASLRTSCSTSGSRTSSTSGTGRRQGGSYAVRVSGAGSRSRRVHEVMDLLHRNGLPNAFSPDRLSGRARAERRATMASRCPWWAFPTGACWPIPATSRSPRPAEWTRRLRATRWTSWWSGAGRPASPPAWAGPPRG